MRPAEGRRGARAGCDKAAYPPGVLSRATRAVLRCAGAHSTPWSTVGCCCGILSGWPKTLVSIWELSSVTSRLSSWSWASWRARDAFNGELLGAESLGFVSSRWISDRQVVSLASPSSTRDRMVVSSAVDPDCLTYFLSSSASLPRVCNSAWIELTSLSQAFTLSWHWPHFPLTVSSQVLSSLWPCSRLSRIWRSRACFSNREWRSAWISWSSDFFSLARALHAGVSWTLNGDKSKESSSGAWHSMTSCIPGVGGTMGLAVGGFGREAMVSRLCADVSAGSFAADAGLAPGAARLPLAADESPLPLVHQQPLCPWAELLPCLQVRPRLCV